MPINPFRPTFGVSPPTLSGRDRLISRFRDAMEAGPTHPDYTMLIASPRGSGKTVLLSAMREAAEEADWVTVRVTAAPGDDFAGLLVEQMAATVNAYLDREVKHRVESAHINIFGVGAGLSMSSSGAGAEPVVHTRMLRTMEALAGLAEELNVGALITIDEFHNSNISGAREFAHALQDVSKIDSRPVMLVGAGLPQMDDTVLADDGMTFFQRVARMPIEPLTDTETAQAIAEPLKQTGRRIEHEALAAAVAATSGYPFMVQLVGYHTWQNSSASGSEITMRDVRRGIVAANAAMREQVLKPVWRDLSETDRRVLVALSRFDDPEVKHCDLMRTTGMRSGYLATYESRLVDAGMIYRPARGRLAFVHSAMRDWLKQNHKPVPESGSAMANGNASTRSSSTVKEQIIAAHHDDPTATHTSIAKKLKTHPGYVGRIRRSLATSRDGPS